MAKSNLHPPFPRFRCFFSTGRPLELSKGQVLGHAGGGDNKRKFMQKRGIWRDVKSIIVSFTVKIAVSLFRPKVSGLSGHPITLRFPIDGDFGIDPDILGSAHA